MKINFKKIFEVLLLIAYTSLVLYLMFFGFNRAEKAQYAGGYRYFLEISRIPLWFPKTISSRWIFSMGNLLAFVPFGIFIPRIFNTKYFKFIINFVFCITFLEILQMVTYLGSFDLEDILVNSLGASMGYFSYKIGNKTNSKFLKLLVTLFFIGVFTILLILFAEYYNNNFI